MRQHHALFRLAQPVIGCPDALWFTREQPIPKYFKRVNEVICHTQDLLYRIPSNNLISHQAIHEFGQRINE